MVSFKELIKSVWVVLFVSLCFLPNITYTTEAPAFEEIRNFPTAELAGLNKTGVEGSGTTQVQTLIGRTVSYGMGFLGALALCLVLYAGVRFMMSQGDVDQQKESLGMMLWAGIGITALLGSYAMVKFVFGIL